MTPTTPRSTGLNGYLGLDVTDERVEVEYWYVRTVTAPTSEQERHRTFTVHHGDPRIHEDPVEAVTARTPSTRMASLPEVHGYLSAPPARSR